MFIVIFIYFILIIIIEINYFSAPEFLVFRFYNILFLVKSGAENIFGYKNVNKG
jgi:hypothetical protein